MRDDRFGDIDDQRPRSAYLATARLRRQPFHSANDQRDNNYVNQITQRSINGIDTALFEYDNNSSPLPGNGNLTDDGTLNYQYDALNRLISVKRASDGAAIAAYVYDAGNRRVRKTVTNGGLAGNIPNGTTDSCWFGWQTMEERNPSGGTDTPTKQYVWGNYIDECLQLNLLAVAGPQQLAVGVYYPLQDTLYRTMALVNSSGTPVEAYDTDAYGNTLIFTGPGPDNTWFTDDDGQSSYGASGIIYCGYRYDAETENYYVRNRYYSPVLGRWLTRDPIGYRGGINLYMYAGSNPAIATDGWGTKAAIQVTGNPSTDTRAYIHALKDYGVDAAQEFLTEAARRYAEAGTSNRLSASLAEAVAANGGTAGRIGRALAAAADSVMKSGMDALAKDLGGQVTAWGNGLAAFASNQYCASWYRQAYQAILAAKHGDPSLCTSLNSQRNNAFTGCYNALATSSLTDSGPLALAFHSFAGYLAGKCNRCGAKKGG
jgi:RHS repeat-associated protein